MREMSFEHDFFIELVDQELTDEDLAQPQINKTVAFISECLHKLGETDAD